MHATERQFVVMKTRPVAVAPLSRERAEATPDVAVGASDKTIALVDWSQLLEDFLDNIGVSFEDFCNEMSGGWMFGYMAALQLAGVRTVLFCVSARVDAPARFRHRATGATICVLPAPRAYRALRRRVLNPYAASLEEAAGDVKGWERIRCAALLELAPYLSTPLLHLRRELRREHCDAILCQDYEHGRFDVCLALGLSLGRLPVFATFQGGDCSRSRLESLTRRVAVRSSSGVIIASSSEAARVQSRYGIGRERVARIFNPLDLATWPTPVADAASDADRRALRLELGISEKARVVVWHGRVDFHRKGLDVLLDAWQRICGEQPSPPERELYLLLVGAGNNAGLLRERIAEMKPHGLVWRDEYLNDRALIRRYLCAADVYAFPSRHEGFPVAPLEAMACGLPLVAADAPGVSDILEGGEGAGGLIVPRGDAVSFASALWRVLDDEAFGSKLGACARARVERAFSHRRVGEQLRAFLFGAAKARVV